MLLEGKKYFISETVASDFVLFWFDAELLSFLYKDYLLYQMVVNMLIFP